MSNLTSTITSDSNQDSFYFIYVIDASTSSDILKKISDIFFKLPAPIKNPTKLDSNNWNYPT